MEYLTVKFGRSNSITTMMTIAEVEAYINSLSPEKAKEALHGLAVDAVYNNDIDTATMLQDYIDKDCQFSCNRMQENEEESEEENAEDSD